MGLGALLLTWGLLAPAVLHTDGRLPLNVADLSLSLTDEQRGLVWQKQIDLMEPADATSVTIRSGTTVRKQTAEQSTAGEFAALIGAQVISARMDRVTGKAVSSASLTYQLATPAAEVPIDGLLVKFPVMTAATTYSVFDETLRTTAPAKYIEQLELAGRTVYHFRQETKPTNLALKYESGFNTTTLADGTAGYLFYEATRDFYVDQNTGIVVDMGLQLHQYYGDAQGNKTQEVFDFAAAGVGDARRAELLAVAADVDHGPWWRVCAYLASWVGGLLLIGSFIAVVGGWRLKRADRRQRQTEEKS